MQLREELSISGKACSEFYVARQNSLASIFATVERKNAENGMLATVDNEMKRQKMIGTSVSEKSLLTRPPGSPKRQAVAAE